jgi:putative membrane protein
MLLDKIPLVSPDYSRPANSLRSRLAVELEHFLSPRALLATAMLVLTPALCLWMYLGSVWDPDANLGQLPAALVNQDTPVVQAGREIDLGGDVVKTLEKEKPFGFVRYSTPEAARAAVEAGKVHFALLIPPDFSRRSVAAENPAQLMLYVSAGGNSAASLLAQRFGTELAHSLNEQLNRERWSTWAGESGRSGVPALGSGLLALQTGGNRLTAHTRRIHAGSVELREVLKRGLHDAQAVSDNTDQVVEKSRPVTEGIKQASATIAGLLADASDKNQVATLGPLVASVSSGVADLKQSLEQLKPDVVHLDGSAGQLQTSASRVLFVGGRLSAEAAKIRSGMSALGVAIGRDADAAGKVNDDAIKLNDGIPQLVTGYAGLEKGLRTLDQKLPTPDDLTGFAHAIAKLHDGDDTIKVSLSGLSQQVAILDDSNGTLEKEAAELSAGLEEAVSRFHAGSGAIGAGNRAASVEMRMESSAPLPRTGPAFAPYFAAIFLWVGALMMSFMFQLRRQPSANRRAWRFTKWFVKVAPLLGLGALQATAVVATFQFMGIVLANPSMVWAVAIVGSFAFVSLTTFFTLVLDNVGKLLGVLLLVFQLAASGGVYPIELSPAFYQNVHGWMPLAFLVRSFRATMFSSFNGPWLSSLQALAIFGAAAAFLGILLARWKYVARETHTTATES